MATKVDRYIGKRLAANASSFIFCGGRRSGKTYGILKFLLLTGAKERIIVNIATMTQEQGRLGSHADAKDIIRDHPATFGGYTILESPREIRHKNGTRIFFNSYSDSETAKGIACDYLFLNEGNKFSKQQYIDLAVNVRRGVFIDYNPTKRFWIDDFFKEEDICHTTPFDNHFLTDVQLETFRHLERLAKRPDATEMDIYNYKVQVLGEYYEVQGSIFTRGNIHFGTPAAPLERYMIFCDPSALRGADYFACVLSATDGERVWVVDTHSVNAGTQADVCRVLMDWSTQYDVGAILIETNGLQGIEFFEFANNSIPYVQGWLSRGKKEERILAKYGAITENMMFIENAHNRDFVEQVYEFSITPKCPHDDNVDALASTISARKWYDI